MQGLAFRVADIRGPQSAGICRNICGPGKSLRYGSKNRSVGGLYKPGDACVAPTKTRPRQERYAVPVAFHGHGSIRRARPWTRNWVN